MRVVLDDRCSLGNLRKLGIGGVLNNRCSVVGKDFGNLYLTPKFSNFTQGSHVEHDTIYGCGCEILIKSSYFVLQI